MAAQLVAASAFRVQCDERIAAAGVAIHRVRQLNRRQAAKVGEGGLGGLRCAHRGGFGVVVSEAVMQAVVIVIGLGVALVGVSGWMRGVERLCGAALSTAD